MDNLRQEISSKILKGVIKNQFIYHPPKEDQPSRYEAIRLRGKQFSELLLDYCPECEERTLAIQKIREAVMWANASIACME